MSLMSMRGWLPLLFIVFSISPAIGQWNSEWLASDSTSNTKNPFVKEEAAIAEGKLLFNAICYVCHGNEGKGDGVSAPGLKRPPADLTSDLVQRQSDGALFWKISEGNPPMLSFKNSLSEEQRWKVVRYIRQLAILYPNEPPIVANVVAPEPNQADSRLSSAKKSSALDKSPPSETLPKTSSSSAEVVTGKDDLNTVVTTNNKPVSKVTSKHFSQFLQSIILACVSTIAFAIIAMLYLFVGINNAYISYLKGQITFLQERKED